MAGSVKLKMVDISNISIFPVLFMILLAEEFTRTQLTKSKRSYKSDGGDFGFGSIGIGGNGVEGGAEGGIDLSGGNNHSDGDNKFGGGELYGNKIVGNKKI